MTEYGRVWIGRRPEHRVMWKAPPEALSGPRSRVPGGGRFGYHVPGTRARLLGHPRAGRSLSSPKLP